MHKLCYNLRVTASIDAWWDAWFSLPRLHGDLCSRKPVGIMINSVVIIGMMGLLFISNVIWYAQGVKDGRREGYVRGRDLSRQGFWQE